MLRMTMRSSTLRSCSRHGLVRRRIINGNLHYDSYSTLSQTSQLLQSVRNPKTTRQTPGSWIPVLPVHNNDIYNIAQLQRLQRLQQLQQRRSYFFIPTFSEMIRSFQQSWTNQKERRTILVKLLKDRTSTATLKSKNYISAANARRRLRFKKYRKNTQTTAQAAHKFVAARLEQTRSKATTRLTNYRIRSMESWKRRFQHYRNRATTRRAITLTEFSQEDWFDKDGYPKTSKDPLTGRFVNPWSSESTNGSHSLYMLLRWRLLRLVNTIWQDGISMMVPSLEPPATTSTKNINDDNQLATSTTMPSLRTPAPADKIRLTWIGHSTCLVEMGDSDFTILTDPHFAHRASPWQQLPVGVARHVPPACSIEDLPQSIDVCCISHDHYDHLDHTSIHMLKSKVKWWVVPLGIKEWLHVECDIPCSQILELEWWQKVEMSKQSNNDDTDIINKDSSVVTVVDNKDANADTRVNNTNKDKKNNNSHSLEITCAPAQHWCSRTPWDRNRRLWCSWAFQSQAAANKSASNEKDGSASSFAFPLKFYFGGDTGLPEKFPLHRQIGDRLGPFDLAALPIGAYKPNFYMKDSHANPAEAVQIHKDVQSKKTVAIHWGTFALAEEEHDEPPKLLREAIQSHQKRGGQQADINFCVVQQGESVESDAPAVLGDADVVEVLLDMQQRYG